MPASQSSIAELNWAGVALDRVLPVDNGLLAVARHLTTASTGNEWERFLAVLTDRGEPRIRSAPLPIGSVLDSQLLPLGTGNAVLFELVSDRSVSQARYIPRWHSVGMTKSRIFLKLLGEMPSMDTHQLRGCPMWDGIAWVGICRCAASASLVLGTGATDSIPQWRHTDVGAVELSELVAWNDQIFFATCVEWKRIELWTFGRDLRLTKLRDIATLDRKGERAKDVLGPVRMARIGNRLYMIWSHYQNRVGSKPPRTWNGRLDAASYDILKNEMQPCIVATDDVRVVGSTVDLRVIGDALLVTYESRSQRNGGMRGFQFRNLEELPRKPDVIPLKTGPVFVVESSGVTLGQNQVNGSWIASEYLPSGTKCSV